MALFHVIDDAHAILRSRGVYRQVKVYRRGSQLYAQYGSGFVGLRRDGGTTVPTISHVHLEGVGEVSHDALGALYQEAEAARKAA
jgi:hypothetical protein